MHNLDFPNPRLSERLFVVPTSSDNPGWTVPESNIVVYLIRRVKPFLQLLKFLVQLLRVCRMALYNQER